MNNTLEAIARAFFKSWFVDFDPVRAKADACETGLPTQISELFPNSFVDSAFGEIPSGWLPGQFGAVAENIRRGISSSKILSVTPYIALENMPKRSIALTEWATAAGIVSNKFEFKAGEILFGKLRPYFHKVGVAPLDGVCSTDILVLRPKESRWFGFVLGHASSERMVNYADSGSTGTKMPRTEWNELAAYEIVLPPATLAQAFNDIASRIVERIKCNIFESHALTKLRDTLLPKLISGELRMAPFTRVK